VPNPLACCTALCPANQRQSSLTGPPLPTYNNCLPTRQYPSTPCPNRRQLTTGRG